MKLPAGNGPINDVARAIHNGRSWEDVAASLGAGTYTVRDHYRPRITKRILRWVDPDGTADPPHAHPTRYVDVKQGRAAPCYPDGRVCDPCLAAYAHYQQAARRSLDFAANPDRVNEIAERLHAGATWQQLADEDDVTRQAFQNAYRPLVQDRCLELIERDQPLEDGRRHGTRTAYVNAGCRCEPCRYSNTVGRREYTLAKRRGTYRKMVDSAPVRQHLKHLRAQGMGRRTVAAASGVAPSSVAKLLRGDDYWFRTRGPSQVSEETAEKLLAVKPSSDALADGARVDARPTQARLRMLREHGWTWTRIGEAVGRSPSNTQVVMGQSFVTAEFARRVIDVVESLNRRR